MEPVKSSIRRQRGVLATVLALPLVAGVATWGLADGWFDAGAAVVQPADDSATIGDGGTIPELAELLSGVPSAPGAVQPAPAEPTFAPGVSPFTAPPPGSGATGGGDPAVPGEDGGTAGPDAVEEDAGTGVDADPGEGADPDEGATSDDEPEGDTGGSDGDAPEGESVSGEETQSDADADGGSGGDSEAEQD